MVLLGLLAMAAFMVLPIWVAYFAIAPLHHLAKGRGRKIRIYVIDYMALLVLVQVALAVCVAGTSDGLDRGLIPAFVLLSILLVVLWWAGVDVLSQLGIRQASRRLMMHLALLPGVCGIMVGTAISLGLFIALIAELTEGSGFAQNTAELLAYECAAIACTLVGIWLLRSMGMWIARGEEQPTPPQQPPPIA